jgi:hypothetical protein
VFDTTTDLLTCAQLGAALDLGRKQLEYLRSRGMPDAGGKGRNMRYRFADVQAWLARRERERLEMPAAPCRRRADGAGAKWLTKQAARAQADQAKPCYSKAGAAGVLRARAWTAEDEADTDDGHRAGRSSGDMPAGNPVSWGAIVAGTLLDGLSWADACKTVRPVL